MSSSLAIVLVGIAASAARRGGFKSRLAGLEGTTQVTIMERSHRGLSSAGLFPFGGSPVGRLNFIHMYFVYFLKSEKNGDVYVGSCQNINVRLIRHNRGLVRSTKAYVPWKLIYFEEFSTRSEAFRKEMFFKTGQQKELLRNKYKDL